jgi:preprotein translocase SecE subunit
MSVNESNRAEEQLLEPEDGVAEDVTVPALRREERRAPAVPQAPARPGFHPREFLDEVVLELRKVIKPKRSELVNYASVVFFTLAFITALVYGLDYVYSLGASQLFK